MDFAKLIESAAATTAEVVAGVGDDQLQGPTPCSEFDVKELGNHMTGFLPYSASAAAKNTMSTDGEAPDFTSGDWGATYRSFGEQLAKAWGAPGAMEGETEFGPGTLPAQNAAGITLMELVVHGWDLAAATGQSVAYAPEVVAATKRVVAGAVASGPADFFHPPVEIADSSADMDLLVALSGRRPDWSA